MTYMYKQLKKNARKIAEFLVNEVGAMEAKRYCKAMSSHVKDEKHMDDDYSLRQMWDTTLEEVEAWERRG